MSWVPIPGTIPALAVAHLRLFPKGTKQATAVLAEAIGHPSQGLAAYLNTARTMGVLVAELPYGDRTLYWSLGDGQHPDDEVDPDKLIGDLIAPKLEPRKVVVITPKLASRPTNVIAPTVDPLEPSIADAKQEGAEKRYSETSPTPQPEKINLPEVSVLDIELPGGPMMPMRAPVPRVRAGTTPARWGFLSDGDLHIQKADQRIELERFEFEGLLDFLKRTCSEAGS